MVEFLVKKTVELSDNECQQILSLFNRTFDKNRTIEQFINQNVQNPFGFAYHTLFICDGTIVGHNAGIPSYYIVNGQKIKVICNIDTMIEQTHRGIENYYELMKTAFGRYKQDGFSIVIGFPNDNAHPLITAIKFLKDVDKLSTYCLPFNVGGIKKELTPLNPLSRLFCNIRLSVATMFASSRIHKFNIAKDDDSYNKTRYKCMDGVYSQGIIDGCEFYYKIKNHEGIRTAFLIDVGIKSAKNFCKV